jgi:hypothetical protein
MSLALLNIELQQILNDVQQLVGSKYKLLLLARYDGGDLDDADIILTNDELVEARRALRRLAEKEGEFK